MFETTVTRLAETIVPSSNIEFFNGTMFVDCSVREAIRLESALVDSGISVIISSVDSDTTAYDFV
jgi:hypothetical protein